MQLSDEQMLTLYTNLVRARRFDRLFAGLITRGKLLGFYHQAEGGEAPGVGATTFLREDDYLWPGLRGHGLPHLIVNGDQRHWGEFITPGILFLYIAGWIGWVGRSYLIAIRDDKKPTQKEIIIDVPLASRLVFRGFSWPVAAYREFVNGDLVAKDV